MIGGVLLAAGAGSRFRAAGGGVKLLAPVGGRPLVEWALAALAEAPLGDRVIVLGAHADELLAATDLQGARPVRNERWECGMASSLQVGLTALDPACTAAVVVLGDGPELAAEAIRRVAVAAAGADGLVAARYGTRHGHPVAIPRTLWARLPAEGEQGARVLGEPSVLVDCSDLPAPGDADTPADLPLP
jgi:CTP:molybdopterin cytidylyltransferase MocA